MRRLFAALAFLAGFLPALAGAQSPPAVPALPDATRLTTYSVSASTCICSVGFAIYGDGTDIDEWIEVWLAGTKRLSTDPTYGWSLSSATGALATIPRPITDAVLTFNIAQTGTVQIIGARRPRRTSQFNENRGVAARDLNQVITDQVATQRETWDLKSRMFLASPGSPGGTVSGIFTTALLTGTSTTSLAIGTGSKTFTTQSGLAFAAGVRLRASATSDLTQWMEGIVTAYSGTSITINVDTINGAGTFASWVFNIAGAGAIIPLAINPPAASLTQGLVVTQSTANTGGPSSANFIANQIVVSDGINAGAGFFGIASLVEQDINTNATGQKAAFYIRSFRQTGATSGMGDQIAIATAAIASVSDGGTNTAGGAHGTIFGANPSAQLSSGATNYYEIAGTEIDVGIATGATSRYRIGLGIVSIGSLGVNGAQLDAAIAIQGATTSQWGYGILFSNTIQLGTGAPVLSTGTLIGTDSAGTVATGIDFSLYTITGNFLNGPGGLFQVTGAGVVTVSPAAGANVTLGGNSFPQIVFTPSAGSTISGQIYQQANVLRLGAVGVGDIVQVSYAGTVNASNVAIAPTLASTSKTTGALTVGGGLGVAGSLFANAVVAAGDPGGTASTNTLSNGSSTTISTGVGSVKMSSANAATNAVWIKVYAGVTAYWIPGWTTNSP